MTMVDDGPRFEFVCLTVTIDKLLREEDGGEEVAGMLLLLLLLLLQLVAAVRKVFEVFHKSCL